MEKTNTNTHKKRKIVALLLCMALAITSIAGAALAKYTTNVSANDTASVAKWHFEVNDVNMTPADGEAEMTFNLFDTIKSTDGSPESAVSTGLIAPGTQGDFAVKIENLSEVDATYSLDFSVANESGIPLKYSVNGTSWYDDINKIDVNDFEIAKENGTATVNVQWKWDFEGGNDAADTALGIAAQTEAPTIEVTCAATFTQVDSTAGHVGSGQL